MVVQIVFEPDIGGYSVGSMMMKPASQPGCVAPWRAQQQPSQPVAVALQRLHLLEHRGPRGRQHATRDDVADLTARMAADDGQGATGTHRSAAHESVARYVQRRRWHATQEIKKVAGGIELTMEVAGTVELTSWVLGFGDKAEVLEPENLREQISAELGRAATRYRTAAK